MRLLDVAGKDLKILLGDRKTLMSILLMPIILTTILSFALGGSFSDIGYFNEIPVAVVKQYDSDENMDRFQTYIETFVGESSKEGFETESFDPEAVFFEEFLDNEEIKKIIDYKVMDYDEAMAALDRTDVVAVVVLPDDYIYDMMINMIMPNRNKIGIRIIQHPDHGYAGMIVEEIMTGYSQFMNQVIISKNVVMEMGMGHGAMDFETIGEDMAVLVEAIMNRESLVTDIRQVGVEGTKTINSFNYYSVAMLTMFMLFSAAIGGSSLYSEKKEQTYDRMKVSGISDKVILGGKYITIVVIALIQTTAMVTFTSLMLKVDWGNLILVALIALSAALAVGGLGILIAVLTFKFDNPKIADLSSLGVQVFALLGGSFLPLEVLPPIFTVFAGYTVNGIALMSFLDVMKGYGLEKIGFNLIKELILAAIFLTAAYAIFMKKGEVSHEEYSILEVEEV